MRRTLLILATLTFSLPGIYGTAVANETRTTAANHPNSKNETKAWLEGMGIDATDGFAKDVLQLMTGIDQRLSPSTSFTVSAGNQIRMGLKF